MSQNFKNQDYNQYAKAWIAKKSSSQHFAHQYLEKPAIFAKLPDLKGKKVLVLGCGSGEECLELLERGAEQIVAIDSSSDLIDWAKTQIVDPKIQFNCEDISSMDFEKCLSVSDEEQKFDLVFSSLTMHYIQDWSRVLRQLKKCLKVGGKFLLSCHHPIKWGAESTRSKDYNSFILGYKKHKNPQKDFEVYGDYLTPRAVQEELFGRLSITHYHKPISLILKIIRDSGFKLLDLLEPSPTQESKDKKDFYETYSKIPLFLILEVELLKI